MSTFNLFEETYMHNHELVRTKLLRQYGASTAAIEELLAYNRNAFAPPGTDSFPMSDEPFVEAWAKYADVAEHLGVFNTIKEQLIQFQFPVEEGISHRAAYLTAVRKGDVSPYMDEHQGLQLHHPEALRLQIYATPAGRIPVLITTTRADFVTLVQALTKRNEPVPIPASMGACIIGGYNNWGRIRALKRQWKTMHPEASEADWLQAFRTIIPQKALYQDRFILLSDGPYSSVPADELGLTDAAWRAHSLTLRLEHECTHYFTRRVLGAMQNALFDELLADYMGLVAAVGSFRADWFLRFMGLEQFPRYRDGGRLQNYRGSLSDDAFCILQALVKNAAEQLEHIDAHRSLALHTQQQKAWMILALSQLTLEHLASKEATTYVDQALASVLEKYDTVIV